VHLAKDKMFVSVASSDKIFVFNIKDLSFITSFGGTGDQDGQFKSPMGIASYGDVLFIADCLNHRICVFKQSDYSFVTQFLVKGFLAPKCICVSDVDQRLYITVHEGVVSYNLKDYSLQKQMTAKVLYPFGICSSPKGSSLYVTQPGDGTLVEIDLETEMVVRRAGNKGHPFGPDVCIT
jgi:DNA-binding beta-propeller fold protein YncE